MNKKIVLVTAIIIVLVGMGIYSSLNRKSAPLPPVVTNFEECEKAGYTVGESYPRQCWTPDGMNYIEDLEPNQPPPFGPIKISGVITCLPKIGTGSQTMECALGLKGADGNNYGLKNLTDIDPENKFSTDGMVIEVTGTLLQEEMTGPDGNKYDIVGVINVSSVELI